MFRKLHNSFTDVMCNPFHNPGDTIQSKWVLSCETCSCSVVIFNTSNSGVFFNSSSGSSMESFQWWWCKLADVPSNPFCSATSVHNTSPLFTCCLQIWKCITILNFVVVAHHHVCFILPQVEQQFIVLFIHLHSKRNSYTWGGFILYIAGSDTKHSVYKKH